jgi:hypothetical protein
LEEFAFRFNIRKSADLFGMTVRRMALAGNLPYVKLVEEKCFHAVYSAKVGCFYLVKATSAGQVIPKINDRIG